MRAWGHPLNARHPLASPRQFLNLCIDESVRLHTMLPGNTVLRKTVADVSLLDVQIPAGSMIWLYPNAVHQDEQCMPPAPNRSPRARFPQLSSLLAAGTSPVISLASSLPPATPLADFSDAKSFCPMRFLPKGGPDEVKRLSDEFELVTFGHGKKRCIGEKMARAMIIAFLGETLPKLDANGPAEIPEDNNLFDLIPASKLSLRDLRPREPPLVQ